MQDKSSNFSSPQGNIYTRQWLPESEPKAVILLVHGMAEHCGRYQHMAEFLTTNGYALCGLDLPGHGNSVGHRVHINKFTDFTDVVIQYYDILAEQYPDKKIFLLGHSMGGLISTNTLLSEQQRFAGCIISATALVPHISMPMWQQYIVRTLALLMPKLGVLQLEAAGVNRDPAKVQEYLDDPLNHIGKASARLVVELVGTMDTVKEQAATINIPMLILHGEADPMTAAAGSQLLHDTISSDDKEVVIYPELFHEIFNESINGDIFQHVLAWLDKRS